MDDKLARLRQLKTRLSGVDKTSLGSVASWIEKSRPTFAEDWPEQLQRFDQAAAEPPAREGATDRGRARQWQQNLFSFVNGMLRKEAERVDPKKPGRGAKAPARKGRNSILKRPLGVMTLLLALFASGLLADVLVKALMRSRSPGPRTVTVSAMPYGMTITPPSTRPPQKAPGPYGR